MGAVGICRPIIESVSAAFRLRAKAIDGRAVKLADAEIRHCRCCQMLLIICSLIADFSGTVKRS